MRPSLEGLVKWVDRPEWDEPFDAVLSLHLAALDEYDLDFDLDLLIDRIGAPAFRMLHGFVFEDFLAADHDDVPNPIDVYLAKRGWKETPLTRTYLAALRTSAPSLYEVSEVRPGVSMLVRDLLRGGERVLVEEKSATATLREWDILATRIVTVRGKTMLSGGGLLFDRATADGLKIEVDRLVDALRSDHLALAAGRELDIPEATLKAAIAALDSIEVVLRSSAFLFSAAWLRRALDTTDPTNQPQIRTAEGDELEAVAFSLNLKPGVKLASVRTKLIYELSLHQADRNFWNWAPDPAEQGATPQDADGISFDTYLEDGRSVHGTVYIEGRSVILEAMSRARAERGAEMLSKVLDGLVLPPVEIEPGEKDEASDGVQLSAEERREILHGIMDKHYRAVLDEAVPALGGLTPREAAASRESKRKVIDWLKQMETTTSGAEGYDFSWIWHELGLLAHRR